MTFPQNNSDDLSVVFIAISIGLSLSFRFRLVSTSYTYIQLFCSYFQFWSSTQETREASYVSSTKYVENVYYETGYHNELWIACKNPNFNVGKERTHENLNALTFHHHHWKDKPVFQVAVLLDCLWHIALYLVYVLQQIVLTTIDVSVPIDVSFEACDYYFGSACSFPFLSMTAAAMFVHFWQDRKSVV